MRNFHKRLYQLCHRTITRFEIRIPHESADFLFLRCLFYLFLDKLRFGGISMLENKVLNTCMLLMNDSNMTSGINRHFLNIIHCTCGEHFGVNHFDKYWQTRTLDYHSLLGHNLFFSKTRRTCSIGV